MEKAYGPNNSILDNCHVRVAFATNDERTARRVSDALGTATELRAMKNDAGHRLSPWLGQLMVSRQETARPLLTPGEVMQLPPSEELVLVSGMSPIRARKVRYYDDARFTRRVLPPPAELSLLPDGGGAAPGADDWIAILPQGDSAAAEQAEEDAEDPVNGGIRREPMLPEHEAIAPETAMPTKEFADLEDAGRRGRQGESGAAENADRCPAGGDGS
ncbi:MULTISPECIES: type IV secretory system conjugative DNA transfer family protein [unclassified Inquilinus]|uniref:type IV secretory system conjugative DNA transfer family protein n=1 Tax=unclassified Inquilinus TaxID=2645927 RepID=UPI003F8FDCBC